MTRVCPSPVLFLLLVLDLPADSSPFSPQVTSLWKEFWSLSCEFSSTIVSRTGRSIPLTLNYDDPEELFDYLYPLANVRLEDYVQQQRSSHSLSTWMDDLAQLIHSECHPDPVPPTPGDEDDLGSSKDYRNSSSQLLRKGRQVDTAVQDGNPSEETETESDDAEVDVTEGSTAAAAAAVVVTPPAPPPAKEKKVIADTDTFFTQYGGDIEYFFPLLSFGIPFDGEITFLGFHGFKGLFPYR